MTDNIVSHERLLQRAAERRANSAEIIPMPDPTLVVALDMLRRARPADGRGTMTVPVSAVDVVVSHLVDMLTKPTPPSGDAA